ncbi:Uncharacterised protein [uncultured archaeon]|nr:Uncharacterised protein [uncultured archaeon]
MPTQTYTGARAIFKINGKKIALATGVSVNQTINYEPVHVLDLLEVEEFCEVSYDCSLTADTMKVIGNSPTQQGIFPHVDLLSILTQPELVAELYDVLTGQLVARVEGIKPNGNNFDVRAGQVVANNLTFVCKRVLDVSEANGGTTPGSGNPA